MVTNFNKKLVETVPIYAERYVIPVMIVINKE